MKRVEPVDDIPHQVAHLCIIDARDFGPGNAATVRVHDKDIRIVAGPSDRRRAGMQRFGFLKIRGMLVNPQGIVDVLAADRAIAEFQAFVEKQDANDPLSMDVVRIRVTLRNPGDSDPAKRLTDVVKARIGVTPVIEIVDATGTETPGGGWKARPIIDLRRKRPGSDGDAQSE